MVVAQLFTFEDFPNLLGTMWMSISDAWLPVVASVLVILEVFALPFLLGLRLSAVMRVVSMISGWVVIAVWFAISFGSIVTNTQTDSALLGATVSLPTGWWEVLFCVALGVLAAWAAWGMWPLGRQK